MIIGLLHPGAMGGAIGAQLVHAGHRVLWCRAGRSEASARRARDAGLEGVPTLADLISGSDVVVSVCPPAAAETVAGAVAETGFTGLFVEANAISPHRLRSIADRLTAAGARVIDGAIIGPPPGAEQTARLYLSGEPGDAEVVHRAFSGTLAEPVRVDGPAGAASGLKMAYGSFQKASRVLAAVSHATAEAYGVTDHLMAEARALGTNALADPDHLPSVAARAWRWAPEMDENAETFAALGLPPNLASGAEAVLRRWVTARDEDLDLATTLRYLRMDPPTTAS